MHQKKASFRKEAAERRQRDIIMEALRLRKRSPAESLKALSAHNEAILRLNRARR